MRILEQTKEVLTLQNPARDFWFGKIVLFFGILFIMVLLAMSDMWWFLLFSVIASFWLLQPIWTSNLVKNCSFDKALDRVTIEFHGLHPKIKSLRLDEIRKIEVRKRIGFLYGAVEVSQLWLITDYAEAFPLSEEYYSRHNNISAPLGVITDQVREFLSPSSYQV